MKDKTSASKHILKDSFKKLYKMSIYLLFFEIIYKGLILILFKPIRTGIVSLFIKAKTYTSVMDEKMMGILFSSLGVIATIMAIILLIVLIYYEITVILMILNSDGDRKRVDLLSISKRALSKIKDLLEGFNLLDCYQDTTSSAFSLGDMLIAIERIQTLWNSRYLQLVSNGLVEMRTRSKEALYFLRSEVESWGL